MSAALNDLSHLAYTQDLRRKLVEQFVADGKYPEDPKMLTILLSSMKDYDKVTLTLRRIDAENENADADRQVLAQFHKLSSMTGSKDYFRTETETPETAHTDGTPSGFNPEEIPALPLVDGELHQGLDSVDYESFMADQDKRRRESLA